MAQVTNKLMNSSNNACKTEKEKTCTVKEYSWKDYSPPEKFEDLGIRSEGYEFTLIMKSPESSHGLRTHTPQKQVLTEQYILDTKELIGIIGGTLGLMVGFSFMTGMEWMVIIFQSLLLKVKIAIHATRVTQNKEMKNQHEQQKNLPESKK